ncbi:hypothetical protein YC2023_022759 [Brassica napus]
MCKLGKVGLDWIDRSRQTGLIDAQCLLLEGQCFERQSHLLDVDLERGGHVGRGQIQTEETAGGGSSIHGVSGGGSSRLTVDHVTRLRAEIINSDKIASSFKKDAASNMGRCATLQHCNLICVDVQFPMDLHFVGVDDLGKKTRGEIDESSCFLSAARGMMTSLSRPCVGIQTHAKTTCHDHVGADVTRGLEKSHDAPTCSTLSVARGKG